jgi:cephalosporin hydroxylase
VISAFEHHPNSCFLGFPMSQNRYAMPAWSFLIEKIKPTTIIEIGTSEGGMSCLLAFAALRTHATFDTFDVGDTLSLQTKEILGKICWPNAGFHRHDAFGDTAASIIKFRIAREGPAIVLCDGGNKGKEFSTYSTLLKPGDIIGVHDARGRESWPWQEFHPEFFQKFMVENCLEEFMPDVFLETGWFVCRKLLDKTVSAG